MNVALEKYIEGKKEQQANREREIRQRELINAGLCERVYVDNEEEILSNEALRYDQSIGRYYQDVPIELTDDEYEEFKKYSTQAEEGQKNYVATALVVCAWIVFIAGFIAGIALGFVPVEGYYSRVEFSFGSALLYWGISFVSGVVLLGFSEIIKLLTAIKNKA